MVRDDVCYLVAENPAAHGIFDKPEETPRMVLCSVRSVGRQEFYAAASNGLHPAVVFTMPFVNYCGEKIVLWQPYASDDLHRYRVLRTYQDGDLIEITCEEATVDA